MSESNFKKSIKNIYSTILYQIITLALGIVIPRLVLVNLGSESNGLLGAVNQAITYLALLEGGVGLTITKALYGPVARQDQDEINGIMSAANSFFRNVGTAYFIGIVAIAIIFPLTIQTTLSRGTVFAVVLLNALPQVVNFFCQQKYRILISISGKGYVLTNLTTCTYIVGSLLKIILLLNGYGLVAVQTLLFVIQLSQMLFISWYITRLYPWLNVKSKPRMDKIGQRRSVFAHQIAGFVFNNTDMLILTYFCNLKVVSVYSTYTMLFSMIGSIGGNFIGSFSFAMGQKFNTDFTEYKKLHNVFETFSMVVNFSLFFVLYKCIIPFLKLYTSGVNDIEYADWLLPILFLLIKLLQAGRYPSQKAIEYAGEFQKTSWHAILETVINLGVSIICAKQYGIYGVLFGTIAALLVRNTLMISFACKQVLHISPFIYLKKWGSNMGAFLGLSYLCNICFAGVYANSYWVLIMQAGVMMVLAAVCFAGIALMYDRASCLYLKKYLMSKLEKRK